MQVLLLTCPALHDSSHVSLLAEIPWRRPVSEWEQQWEAVLPCCRVPKLKWASLSHLTLSSVLTVSVQRSAGTVRSSIFVFCNLHNLAFHFSIYQILSDFLSVWIALNFLYFADVLNAFNRIIHLPKNYLLERFTSMYPELRMSAMYKH